MAAPRFSLALGIKKTSSAPPPKRKAALSGHDSDIEDEEEGKAQDVSHFDQDAGGAIHKDRVPNPKEQLVIKGPANRDWRDASRRKRQKTALPGQGGRGEDVPGEEMRESGAPKSYGLNIVEKRTDTEPEADVVNENTPVEGVKEDTKAPAMTDDERALAALLGDKAKSDLVLPHIESEEQAFDRDYRDAPDAPSLAEYNAVPVEEFGAALLRGMGWKDGESIGKQRGQRAPKPTLVERRPALLGIGAKQDAAVGVELGAWGKGAKGKKKLDQDYTPVLLENKKTGEKLTEEELKARIESQKLLASERTHDKDRSRHGSDRDYDPSSKRRKHRGEDDYDSRDRDYKRKGKDRDSDSRRRRYSLSPDEKDRRKSDKRRDEDERRHRSPRRERSSSSDSRHRSRKHSEKERNYDDDRHRSSKRDRSRSRDRHHRSERKDRKEKHRDKDDHRDVRVRERN